MRLMEQGVPGAVLFTLCVTTSGEVKNVQVIGMIVLDSVFQRPMLVCPHDGDISRQKLGFVLVLIQLPKNISAKDITKDNMA